MQTSCNRFLKQSSECREGLFLGLLLLSYVAATLQALQAAVHSNDYISTQRDSSHTNTSEHNVLFMVIFLKSIYFKKKIHQYEHFLFFLGMILTLFTIALLLYHQLHCYNIT